MRIETRPSLKRHASDPTLVELVLVPYKKNCRYLLSAHLEHEDSMPERSHSRTPLVAAQGEFSIPESCYIADTGHFNSVEFNICYNQLAYFLMASCVKHQLEPLADWSMEEYRRRQLGDFLIVQFSSSFRKEMKSDHFTGRVEIHQVRGRSGPLFMKTYCRFEDDKGGLSEGEILLAVVGDSTRRAS